MNRDPRKICSRATLIVLKPVIHKSKVSASLDLVLYLNFIGLEYLLNGCSFLFIFLQNCLCLTSPAKITFPLFEWLDSEWPICYCINREKLSQKFSAKVLIARWHRIVSISGAIVCQNMRHICQNMYICKITHKVLAVSVTSSAPSTNNVLTKLLKKASKHYLHCIIMFSVKKIFLFSLHYSGGLIISLGTF